MEFIMIETGWLSILPPMIAIALALLTKEVYSSLFIGLFSGMLIYRGAPKNLGYFSHSKLQRRAESRSPL